jgi:hypothetical protein
MKYLKRYIIFKPALCAIFIYEVDCIRSLTQVLWYQPVCSKSYFSFPEILTFLLKSYFCIFPIYYYYCYYYY